MSIKNILIWVALFFTIGLVIHWRLGVQHRNDQKVSSGLLPASDSEKIIVDPRSHQIEIITKSGIKKEFLPGMRPSSVEIRKNGQVIVTSPQWGFEHGLFAGGGFANDGLRVGCGLDLFYWHKVDAGLMLTDSTKDLTKVRISAILSYTVWHETRVGIGLDNTGSPNLLLTEKF